MKSTIYLMDDIKHKINGLILELILEGRGIEDKEDTIKTNHVVHEIIIIRVLEEIFQKYSHRAFRWQAKEGLLVC